LNKIYLSDLIGKFTEMENNKGMLENSVESIEIEEDGLLVEKIHRRISKESGHISASIINVSVDIRTDEPLKDKYLTGVFLMIITILMWSIMHIATKIMYNRSPEITCFDAVFPMGLVLPPVYFLYSRVISANLSFFSFPKNLRYLLVFRVCVGMLNNICLFTGLRYISVGKGILTFSTAPLFCSLAAGVFLKERITITDILLTL
jgi:hypothetical protein